MIRWIQLSDLHFQTKLQTYNTKQLRDTLPKYLRELDGPFDAMVITGDYRYAPEGEENSAGIVDYINDLACAVNVEKKNIVTVPGNHDLTRNAVRTAIISDVRNKYNPQSGVLETELLESLQSDFGFYKNLHESLGDASGWSADNPHCVVEMEACNFLLLNTALIAGTDQDEGQLVWGSMYLDGSVSSIKNGKPTIAVGHHGMEFLMRDERNKCAQYLERHGIRLYLCGHTHDAWFSSFGEGGRQVNCGCAKQDDTGDYVGFCVGELYDDGTVKIESHKWDMKADKWIIDMAFRRDYAKLYEGLEMSAEEEEGDSVKPEKIENPLSIHGYVLLGGLGVDGIKYIWMKNGEPVESLAFNRRLKMDSGNPVDKTTSSYTVSTSIGCELSVRGKQCRFCETGRKKFVDNLKAEDIALQCIFMAKYDGNCSSYPQVKNNLREFAFMGQGEPGYNYPSIRQAIMMTDYIMERIGQKVARYIISTCGISDFMPSLIKDIQTGVFKNRVTVHFSLHAVGEERNILMPINMLENYHNFIKYCSILNKVCGEKIGVGILLFDKYQIDGGKKYSLTKRRLEEILSQLDKDVFRIDLCSVNKTSLVKQHQMSNEKASELLEIVKKRGYEGKLFTSFGDSEKSGCGMLESSLDNMEDAGSTTIEQFNQSVELLREAVEYVEKKLLEG